MSGAEPQSTVHLADRFERATGRPPEGLWRAPGRVNLIGEHTDYNAGFAIPFAIDRYTTVAVGTRADRRVRCFSTGAFDEANAELHNLRAAAMTPWARYPIGVLWALQRLGCDVPGVDIGVDSTLPVGSGLSSSAALEAAVAVALNDLCQSGLDRQQLAGACHRAECDFVGAPVGMLDQLAVLCAREGKGLLIDFRSLILEALPLARGPYVVVDTHVQHRNADGAYAARRRSCLEAAARLGLPDLRDATASSVDELDGELRRRARHVVSENERVLEAAQRLRSGLGIGDLLSASHASLRDDYQVSCPELDAVVEAAMAAGAVGARLTGAGFGGCAVVLGLAVPTLADAIEQRWRGTGLRPPTTFEVVPSEGAGRIA